MCRGVSSSANPFRARHCGKVAIERPFLKLRQRGGDDVRILQRQVFVVEQIPPRATKASATRVCRSSNSELSTGRHSEAMLICFCAHYSRFAAGSDARRESAFGRAGRVAGVELVTLDNTLRARYPSVDVSVLRAQ